MVFRQGEDGRGLHVNKLGAPFSAFSQPGRRFPERSIGRDDGSALDVESASPERALQAVLQAKRWPERPFPRPIVPGGSFVRIGAGDAHGIPNLESPGEGTAEPEQNDLLDPAENERLESEDGQRRAQRRSHNAVPAESIEMSEFQASRRLRALPEGSGDEARGKVPGQIYNSFCV